MRRKKDIAAAVSQLQRLDPAFKRLKCSTVRGWFTKESKHDKTYVLKEKYQDHYSTGSYKMGKGGRHSALPDELKERVKEMLLHHRRLGVAISSEIARSLIWAVLKTYQPDLLDTFKVSASWTRHFLSEEMDWSSRSATSAHNLPSDHEQKLANFVQKIAYVVKQFNIPPALCMNSDQAGQRLVTGDRTYEERGARHVRVIGQDDKRQITW